MINFADLFESDAAEAARLAAAPEGSESHRLSALPVTIEHPESGQLISIPILGKPALRDPADGNMIVVCVADAKPRDPAAGEDRSIWNGWYRGIIVFSNMPTYPVGGYDITVSESQLRRGLRIDLGTLL